MPNHAEATTTQAPQVAPVAPTIASGPAFIAPEADQQVLARNNQYVLKSGDAFVVSDALGDIGGHDDGLFVDDMRVLSKWRLTFGGRAPSLLSGATSADNASFTAHLTNRPLPPLGGHETPEGVIHIERMRVLAGDVLYEALTLTNYGASEAEVPLSLSFAADFKDMFEVRGTQRPKRGTVGAPRVDAGAVRLRYDGLDGVERNVTVHFSPAPDALSVDRADYTLTIAAQACVSIYLTVDATLGPEQGEGPGCGRVALRTALVGVHREMRARRESMARVNTGNPLFDAWLDRSLADLGLLTTQLDTGPYPYAGIPWFSTPFGRDAIITSLQMLWLQPSLARGVLRFLAEHQARETSAFRDAEPGKIMHEFRRSEMAATGEVPFALYYGGVDTTPLFIVLAGAYLERTGDDALIDELWPALERAAQWVIDKCDRNPYGLLDYQRTSERGLANQGWKDSHDSVFHADGRFPDGPIALVEVQAYACAALDAMSACSHRRGHAADATRYGDKTAAVNLLRALFEAAVSFEMRLPELFCGFPRRRGEPPTAYPVACLPQAWAAGAPFMMLQACLGVSIDASRHEVRVERPALPEGVDWLRIDALRVGDETVSLTFRRVDGQVVAAAEQPGRVKVVAVL